MNFDCGKCFYDIQEIQNFYIQLLAIKPVTFCIITDVESINFIKHNFDKTFSSYDIHIIKKSPETLNKLFLLNRNNRLVMAGDITKYPFLKKRYLQKFEKER